MDMKKDAAQKRAESLYTNRYLDVPNRGALSQFHTSAADTGLVNQTNSAYGLSPKSHKYLKDNQHTHSTNNQGGNISRLLGQKPEE
jgi:hypothetical protein